MSVGIVLVNPKFGHNIGAALRACACFGVDQLFYTGDRVDLRGGKRGTRIPREERMKGYRTVALKQVESTRDLDLTGYTPVGVEIRPDFQNLVHYQHPLNAFYFFGPEDGNLPPAVNARMHAHIQIPSFFCLNLAAAVYVTLYDRMAKSVLSGQPPPEPRPERELNLEEFGK